MLSIHPIQMNKVWNSKDSFEMPKILNLDNTKVSDPTESQNTSRSISSNLKESPQSK